MPRRRSRSRSRSTTTSSLPGSRSSAATTPRSPTSASPRRSSSCAPSTTTSRSGPRTTWRAWRTISARRIRSRRPTCAATWHPPRRPRPRKGARALGGRLLEKAVDRAADPVRGRAAVERRPVLGAGNDEQLLVAARGGAVEQPCVIREVAVVLRRHEEHRRSEAPDRRQAFGIPVHVGSRERKRAHYVPLSRGHHERDRATQGRAAENDLLCPELADLLCRRAHVARDRRGFAEVEDEHAVAFIPELECDGGTVTDRAVAFMGEDKPLRALSEDSRVKRRSGGLDRQRLRWAWLDAAVEKL